MRKLLALLVVAALVAAPALALTSWYSSGAAGLSVTSTNSKVTFTYNVSGGTSGAFAAHYVSIHSRDDSADTCYFRLQHSPATTADVALAPGATWSLSWDSRDQGEGWGYLAMICDTGDTATFDVVASR